MESSAMASHSRSDDHKVVVELTAAGTLQLAVTCRSNGTSGA
uniref:Uncharacterized protein n=1 Tax=Arundo donax TaxID=35708 RepID=A0A0A9EPK0_ARUDO